jgi:hypothetical protein
MRSCNKRKQFGKLFKMKLSLKLLMEYMLIFYNVHNNLYSTALQSVPVTG